MKWSLYKEGKFLEPLKFSNGKTQKDVAEEVLSSIKKGNKIIFVKGICGTGKSAIALNIAKELGKTSIVVPIKNLQAQYEKDYCNNMQIKNSKNEKLRIGVMTGRKNHKCKFLEENQKEEEFNFKREVNSKLHDIFSGVKKPKKEKDLSADNFNLPCKIEIREKNWNKIKEYLKKNKDVDVKNFSDIKDVKRASVAASCPYWCPVLSERYEFGGRSFINAIKKKYSGINNEKFVYYERKSGCGFYNQFNSYVDSDVIVFNSMKYKLESALDRKPLTEVEIIDECDEFLDSFSNQRSINLERLQNSLMYFFDPSPENQEIIEECLAIIKQIKKDGKIKSAIERDEIISLRETGIYDLLRLFLKNKNFVYDFDDESYVFEVQETARIFEGFLDETYLIANKKDENTVVNLVTTNLAKKFETMANKNKVIVLMSGTIHSSEVLEKIFGMKDYDFIEAETGSQGRIEIKKSGREKDCKYANFKNNKITREEYLKNLDNCVEVSKKPTLVHVNAYLDLPSEEEREEFDLANLISREKLRELQNDDKTGVLIERFKMGKINVLFSTRAGRGIDFPGGECNSIVFTKYPNPNVKDAFWRILNKTNPMHYWEFYRDKAKREIWQKVYRGIRSKNDHVYVLSPDLRVLNEFENADAK
ncbi:MAG: helicase C-terminal domain-containing protein [Candidatus Pacearchaeota archaeon]|jgi:Rad3-related DNA helicase